MTQGTTVPHGGHHPPERRPSGATAPGGPDDGYVPAPNRWAALWANLGAGFIMLLDVSIVNVALPDITRTLGASAAGIQWVVSGYSLTYGLVLVLAGRIGDARGRKRMFQWSLAAFVLCSAAAGAAPTATFLVVARLLQGMAAGCLAPQNTAIIQQLFRGAERGRAFGWFGSMVGVSTAIGPVLGGLIIGFVPGDESWRWIFYVNVPVGALALVMAQRLIPADVPGRREHLDLAGVGLLGAGVLAAMLPLMLGVRSLWWLFPVAAVVLAGFARWELRVSRAGGSPLLDPALVTSTRGFATGAALGTTYFIAVSGVWLVFALFFQESLGFSALHSGLSVIPFAIGSGLAAPQAGRLVNRFGRRLTLAGLLVVTAGFAACAVIVVTVPPAYVSLALAPALLVSGMGGGCVISPNTTMTLRNVPVLVAGAASGAMQTGQRLAGAVGTAMLPAVYYAAVAAHPDSPGTAGGLALAATVGCMVLPLSMAVVELVGERRNGRTSLEDAPAPVAAEAGASRG